MNNQVNCLNCGESVIGSYCSQCGQKISDNADRSLSRLVHDFFTNTFLIDNRFITSLLYLLIHPGQMTVEFLEGKRKRFVSPVSLFIAVNVIYFLVNPLTDYSLSLTDQISYQPYSPWSKELVSKKLELEGIDFKEYRVTYQKMSDNISKSAMILNVPMIAGFVFIMSFRRRQFYFDSLIFCFHFFTLFMISWILGKAFDNLLELVVGNDDSILSGFLFFFFVLAFPFLHGIISFKKYLNLNWLWGILGGIGLLMALVLVQFVYRALIFVATFLAT